MEEFELRDQLILGEDSTRQFKRAIPHADSMIGELVAFCNSDGGRVYFGVEDDGTISGLTPEQAQAMGGDLANRAWEGVKPPISILTESVATSDGIVLVVSVPSGSSKPYCDKQGQYWVKNGPDKRRVQSPEELARLFQLGDKLYAESQVVASSSLNDFDRESFNRFYRKKYDEPSPLDDGDEGLFLQTLANLHFIEGPHMTVVGILLFGKRVDVLLPEMKIDAVWFKGTERAGTDWWDQRTITGPLALQYDQAMGFLSRWSSRLQTEPGFNTHGNEEIPLIVFQELLVNALVHRDYFVRDSIKLFIFDDRIEIRSPGKLPNSLTVDQIRRGVRRSRNALLASFAPDLLNYRGVGSGVVRALHLWANIDWNNDVVGEELSATIRLA